MSAPEWHYSLGDDDRRGPVGTRELSRLATNGELQPDHLVWKKGMAEWVPARRVKGLEFAVATAGGPPSSPAFDGTSPSLNRAIAETRRRAEQAEGALWFLDLKFNRFVSATIIRIVWTVYLALLALAFIGFLGYGLLNHPVLEVALGIVAFVLGYGFLTLLFRMFLEAFMVIFRIAEHMRELNAKLSARQ